MTWLERWEARWFAQHPTSATCEPWTAGRVDLDRLAEVSDLYRRETAGSMVGRPIRLPDGEVYEIVWDDDDELEGAA